MFLPILHGGSHGPFMLAWHYDPLVLLGLVLVGIAYGYGWQQLRQRGKLDFPAWYAWSFYAGLILTAFALLGPLDAYNDQLFVLHMAQHLVIVQIIAPLLLLGRPVQLVLRAIPPKYSKKTVGMLFGKSWRRTAITLATGPVVAAILFNINMGFWHLPAYYEAALRNDLVHELEHMLFFGSALLFWWMIIDPVPRHHKMSPLLALVSLFFSMMVGSVIGAVQTFASHVIYPFYLEAETPWGLTPLVDQQIGGLLMWVGTGFVYFAIMFFFVVQLLKDDSSKDENPFAYDSTVEPQLQTSERTG